MKINVISVIIIIALSSCKGQVENNKTTESIDKQKIDTISNEINIIEEDFEEGQDELVSDELFKNWQGTYILKEENIDAWGRESVSNVKIELLKPNKCIYESWLSGVEGVEYEENSNRYKIIGGVQINSTHDSLSFYSSKFLIGESMNLSPVFTLIKRNGNYFISSILTSPPHNGIVEMPIMKE